MNVLTLYLTGLQNTSNDNGNISKSQFDKIQNFAQTGYLYLSSNSENKQVLFSSAELIYLYFYCRISVSL